MNNLTLGFAICGSFCTFNTAISEMLRLVEAGHRIIPIMSFNAANLNTKFGESAKFRDEIENICNNEIIDTIPKAEPLGPNNIMDLLIISPCTGNTLGKLSSAITDTPVTMAAKSQLRVKKPVLIALCSNDALGLSAQNIGKLLMAKNIYFLPMYQDDTIKKPNSLVSRFELMDEAIDMALKKEQIQPVFC